MSQGFENTLNSANIVGPVASVGGALYAVATDTWWVGVATMVATAAGVLLNVFKVWKEANNVELNSKLAASQKEIDDLKSSFESTKESFESTIEKNQETITLLSKSYEHSISLLRSGQSEIAQLKESVDELIDKVQK